MKSFTGGGGAGGEAQSTVEAQWSLRALTMNVLQQENVCFFPSVFWLSLS